LITEENWINFIRTFFGAEVSNEWVHHVAVGWNHHKNEAGCHCSFVWYAGPSECEIYTGIKAAKEQFDSVNTGEIYKVDIEGVGQFIERGEDFYEKDEPVKEVLEAFDNGEQGVTAPTTIIMSTDDFLNAIKDHAVEQFEDEAVAVTETGSHPKLKQLVADYMSTTKADDLELPRVTDTVLPPYAETDIKATQAYHETVMIEQFEEDGPGSGEEKGSIH
jgi:hypothetical protein